MNTKFTTNHNNWDTHSRIPFAVSSFGPDQIYLDPIWGVKIEKITVDNTVIAAMPHDIDLDDINFKKRTIGAEPYIYQARRLDLVFAKHFSDSGDYELEKYSIPKEAQQIVIEYRLRVAPDKLGPVLTLVSMLA